MNVELIQALDLLEKERGISKEYMLDSIETSLTQNYSQAMDEDVLVTVDRTDGEISFYRRRLIVDEVNDPGREISLAQAKEYEPRAEVGGTLHLRFENPQFGRSVVQKAKQVVIQKMREAERGMVMSEYTDKENELLQAVVRSVDKTGVTVLLDKTMGVIPSKETMPNERYHVNDKLKVYVVSVSEGSRGPQVTVSRSHPNLVKRLFELEVPEIQNGTILVKGIAREAGSRSKMAVYSKDSEIDAIGACVGQGGSRVSAVINELHGERIDIIRWSSAPEEFISNALSPARVAMVFTDEEKKEARVIVPDNQLSLAIGKEGQNARLAAKLTGWKIDIKSQGQFSDMM